MRRVVVLGRGGAGKSTLARRLGVVTGLPVVELDAIFWRADLTGPSPEQWSAIQRDLTRGEQWILDGDLGPHDEPAVRLAAADTVIVLTSRWPGARGGPSAGAARVPGSGPG